VPVLVDSLDVLAVVAGTLLVCLGATWLPARRAQELSPAEGLRH